MSTEHKIAAYILKRILLMIPTLLGITLITFFIIKLAPGDPVKLKLMFMGEGVSADDMAAILKSETPAIELPDAYVSFSKKVSDVFVTMPNKDYDQDMVYKSFKFMGENTVFYFKWISNIVVLDFGRSFKDRQPVIKKIKEALPITLLINILAILIVYSISIPLGIWSALKRGTVIDKVVMVQLFILYSLPGFWIATMLLMYLAGGEYLNIFPIVGFKSDFFSQLSFFEKVLDVLWHLVLPVIVSTIGGFAFLSRFSRSNFLDVIGQDYIRTARAKGLSESKVLYKHGLRNALIPFVTLMGTLLPALLGGSVIVEQIFSIPGMGMLSFEAVLGRDHNLIMGVATIGAFLTLVSLLIADLMYVVVDPRIRLE
ncbi:MAG: ABC transporter permease [bacterium]